MLHPVCCKPHFHLASRSQGEACEEDYRAGEGVTCLSLASPSYEGSQGLPPHPQRQLFLPEAAACRFPNTETQPHCVAISPGQFLLCGTPVQNLQGFLFVPTAFPVLAWLLLAVATYLPDTLE